ncbi:class F sortase [Streptomyces alkaliphilus]|uniref:Class F sortase n=1 Tax=Streptomyces alkaliphilus TaxID=1472722 RepID=A0A7W3TG85_9ACTN|nr:class F sortase [Streptomyces alkaliphilus]
MFARWGVGTPVEEDRPVEDTDAGNAPPAEPAPRRARHRRRGPIRVARDRVRAFREAVRRMLDRVDLWLERRYHAGARLLGRVPWHVPLIPWRRLAARSRARGFAATGLNRRQRLAPRRRRLEVVVATGSVVLCAVLAAAAPSPEAGTSPTRTAGVSGSDTERVPAVDGDGAEIAPGVEAGMERAEPTRVRIPWLRADVEVFGADLDPDGGPPSPAEEDAMRAAWYAGGVSPGERGAALLVGHLDTRVGPAAFAGLGMLEPGEIIEVDRADDTTAIFTVEAVEQYPKADFPDERVYGAVETPQLRLITCGGRWTADGGYDANIVAYATLTDTVRHTD